jgi:hypothetical protein
LEKLDLNKAFELISQQTELKDLKITIQQDYEWTVKNDGIQVSRLEVNALVELSVTSRRNLEQFVKSQKKIESFEAILYNSDSNRPFYSSILKYVQTLDTLRSISVENIGLIGDFKQTKNCQVENLTIRKSWGVLNDRIFIKLFPNIKRLEIHFLFMSDDVIQLINNMPFLEELVIVDLGERRKPQVLQKITKLQIKNLKKAELYSNSGCDGAKIVEFTKKHPNLTEFRFNVDPIQESTHLKVLESTLKNLKNLKKLMMYVPFKGMCNVSGSADEICKLIGDNAPQLDTLALNFGMNDEDSDILVRRYDREYLDYCKIDESRFIRYSLPHLKFKFLYYYTKNPWN